MITSETLRRLPKAELHCHLDGSLRPATLLELGREYGVDLPTHDVDELAEYMLVADARNLENYLRRFEITIPVLQTADAISRVTYELGEDAAEDGVRYLEVRNAPQLNTRDGLELGGVIEAMLEGGERAERDHGIKMRFIVIALRDGPPATSMEMARLAVAYKTAGVVAFDLAGGEAGNPAEAHAAAFRYARENDLAVTVHAGEGDGAESVRQAVHACGAHRIGHGTRLIEDQSLTRYVTDRRIALEICLTSNVHTRAVASYAAHPLRDYYDAGALVTLNTDNRLMSGTTLTDEFTHAWRELDFGWDDLCVLALNGFEAAFATWEERQSLMTAARQEIDALSRRPAADVRK